MKYTDLTMDCTVSTYTRVPIILEELAKIAEATLILLELCMDTMLEIFALILTLLVDGHMEYSQIQRSASFQDNSTI
jgi:hypothetical protein